MALLHRPISLPLLPLAAPASFISHPKHIHLRKVAVPKFRSAPPTVALLNLNPPPYDFDALEPHMSKQALSFHWGKHHQAYVDNCNNQIKDTELEECTLEDIIKKTYNNGDPLPVFNNAAQAWNHEFFWECMKPRGGKEPKGEILELIKRDFGAYDEFLKEFKQASATQFGSGWAWLVLKDNKLVIEKTPNALNPLIWGHKPLLTIDVWEHAYYLDYQNRRPDYISTFMNELVSWDAVNARLDRAKASAT